jgi:hypothetical protein
MAMNLEQRVTVLESHLERLLDATCKLLDVLGVYVSAQGHDQEQQHDRVDVVEAGLRAVVDHIEH